MVFSSLLFLTRFLPVVMILYFLIPKRFRGTRNLVLFLASILFYAWGEPVYILLMLFTICVDYVSGILIDRYLRGTAETGADAEQSGQQPENEKKAKVVLVIAMVINLALLGFFKYANFLIETINSLTGAGIGLLDLALPIGISFYTFQSMSYVIDVYRGDTKVQKNILSFGTYVTLFPQLIAGPIVRYRTVAEEMDGRSENIPDFSRGVNRFLMGLGKKVLLANNIGAVWDLINAMPDSQMSVALAWLGIAAYTFQIYFDFSGYSDMAIGLGLMLGFHFDENFNYPYTAVSVTDFWRRWHISLSTWFREYVYIPLGGNRHGTAKQIRNLLIVWILTGFWHGAAWNFVAWGLYYGIILILEKFVLSKWLAKLPRILQHVYTMLIVMIGWVFFSAESFGRAFHYIAMLFGGAGLPFINGNFLYQLRNQGILFVLLILAAGSAPKTAALEIAGSENKHIRRCFTILEAVFLAGIAVISFAYLVDATYNPFLYFRF